MKLKTFLIFVSPSLLMIFLFIALPLFSVLFQSFHVTQNTYKKVEVETCTPSFTGLICQKEKKDELVLDKNGIPIKKTLFVGIDSYKKLLKTDNIKAFFLKEKEEKNFSNFLNLLENIDFFQALRFTLTFCLITLPFVIVLGLLVALSVDQLVNSLKGPVIFVSLLPFIITPIIGAISIKWLFIGDGIITSFLEFLLKKDIAIFANPWAIEGLMIFYRIWHVVPFAFVVFYAGLQTVNQDTLDASVVDGASQVQRLFYVIIPHLNSLIIFVSLIHLMDSFRVFEEVIGFSSQAYRISLQWLTYDLLTPDEAGTRAISRASASSMLTMLGIVLLLIPILKKTWKDHKK